VLIREWDGRRREPGEELVFLTNGPVDDPFVVFDDYDERSLIENTLHRETKQSFSLGALPKKRANALYAHTYMVLCSYAIIYGYRRYMASKSDSDAALWPPQNPAESQPTTHRAANLRTPPQPFQGVGMARWRRQLAAENADKVIVFLDSAYGIYDLNQLAALTGIRVKMTQTERARIREVLAQYGIDFPP
jgi:hypothetical protein